MSGIKFYEKNKIDLEYDGITITVTDTTATNNGSSFVDYVRNRKNTSGWVTTGSDDAANTTLEIDMGDSKDIDIIALIGHNLGAYTIQYWNGSSYLDFSTPIAETSNTDYNTYHSFDLVRTSKFKMIITGTQTADQDKYIRQLIATEEIGQFNYYPVIRRPMHDTRKRITRMLSGKKHIVEATGAFSCTLSLKALSNTADLALIETLYFNRTGFLMLLSGENESQFSNELIGYRNEDIYLMRCTNSYTPEYLKGIYQLGTKVDMKVEEVTS